MEHKVTPVVKLDILQRLVSLATSKPDLRSTTVGPTIAKMTTSKWSVQLLSSLGSLSIYLLLYGVSH